MREGIEDFLILAGMCDSFQNSDMRQPRVDEKDVDTNLCLSAQQIYVLGSLIHLRKLPCRGSLVPHELPGLCDEAPQDWGRHHSSSTALQ